MIALSTLSERTTRVLGSKIFWRLVLGLFLLEALWFVFSAQYPMAFDENYHFGLIKLHAQQWVPFFTSQPNNASVFGAVVRDPSYLYHWLMSFPYRGLELITSNQTAQIIVLRLINVALFTYSLLLYRRIVQRLGVSRPLTNSLFAIFALIPVVPFLAAHINYDNLFMVAVALTTLLTLKLTDTLKAGQVDAQQALLLIALLALSSLIKYPFLPIALVVAVFVIWRLGQTKLLGMAGLRSFAASFLTLSRLRQVLLVLFCLVSLGLFTERYVQNIITYHNPVPACDAVISQDECSQYGPYGRDHLLHLERPASFHAHVAGYLWQWLYGMWYRLFFAINYDYSSARPLIVISWAAVLLAVLLFVGIAMRLWPLLRGRTDRQLAFWLTFGYLLVLFADGFEAYGRTGQPVAINGRYLIPVLPFIFALGGVAWSQILRRYSVVKTATASLIIAVFLLQGGGTMTFIVRSGDSWMWNNGTVRAVNRVVRSAAWPFIIGKNIW